MFDDLTETDVALAVLRSAEVAAARAAVAQWDAALAVWESTPDDHRVGRRPQASAEIGMALGLSALAVEHRLRLAEALRSWPLLRGLLVDGRLGLPHALAAVDELAALGDEALAGRVLVHVLASSGRWGWADTPARLRTALQVAAVLLDPEGAALRREERQTAESRVRLRARSDGVADLTATGPAEQLGAADRLLDLLSAPAGPDDQRTRGQRQVDALVAALVRSAGVAVPLELQLQIPVALAVAGVVAQDDPDRTALPEPLVVVTDLGPELLDRLQQGPQPPARPDADQPDAEEPQHARPWDDEPVTGRAAEAGDGTAGAESVAPTAPGGVASRTVSWHATTSAPGRSARRRPYSGVPLLAGHGPVDPARVLELLTDPAGLPVGLSRVQVRRVLVTRDGAAVAVDAHAVPLARLLAGPGGLLARLLQNLPAPPPTTDAYRPTAAQDRVVCARDRTCVFPGCPRRASQVELDHRVRWPAGPTSTANLHPLCKHHHRLKHDGWQCVRQVDGSTVWTSPRGQTRTTARP